MQTIIEQQDSVKKRIINDYIKRHAINQYKLFDKEQIERQKKHIKTRRKYN